MESFYIFNFKDNKFIFNFSIYNYLGKPELYLSNFSDRKKCSESFSTKNQQQTHDL